MQCQALAPPPRHYREAAPAKAGVEPISRAVLPVKAIPKQVPPQLPAVVAAPKPAGAPPIQEAVQRTVPVKAPPQVAAADAASSSVAARYKTPSASGASSSQGASVHSERIVLPLPAKAPEAIARSSAAVVGSPWPTSQGERTWGPSSGAWEPSGAAASVEAVPPLARQKPQRKLQVTEFQRGNQHRRRLRRRARETKQRIL